MGQIVNSRVVTCFECGRQGHYRSYCPKLKDQNRRNKAGNKNGVGEAIGKAYVLGGRDANPDSNVVKGTFLLNNYYAFVLLDSGADQSFVSTTFGTLLDITPDTLDVSCAVELADRRIFETNIVLKGCTLGLLGHPFNIDLMPVELGSFDVIIGMDWLANHHACERELLEIGGEGITLVGRGECGEGGRLKLCDQGDLLEDDIENLKISDGFRKRKEWMDLGRVGSKVAEKEETENFRDSHDGGLISPGGPKYIGGRRIKVNGVIDDAIRLYLFPHSLTHHAIAWFERLLRNSINTFEQMAKMFLGKYFPPSKSESSSSITSSSDPEIVALKAKMAEINKNLMKYLQINQQLKAVAHNCETCGGPHSYNDCPATVGQTQIVYAARAYQGGNSYQPQATVGQTQIVYAARAYQGGNSYQPQGNCNLLSYRLENYLGPSGFNQNQNKNKPNQNYQNQNRNQGNNHGIPQGNNQKRNQFFQGASHGQNPPPAYQAPGYQALVHQASIPQPQVVTTNEFTNYMKVNDAILKNMQTNMTSLKNLNLKLKNMFGQFMKMNTASSSDSGSLPSNTITNPKEDLKGITTRSGTAYKGPTIPTTSSPSKVVKRETEVTKDTVPPTNNGSTKDVQPLVVQTDTPIPNSEHVVAPVAEPLVAPVAELVVAPVSAPKPNPKPSIPYPSRLHDQKLRDKANDQKEKFFQIFKDLDFNISFEDALILMPKFGSTIKSLLTNKEKLYELARTPLNEHCSAVLRKKLPEKLGTPATFLYHCSISRPVGVAEDVFVKVGTFHFPANFVVVDFDADPRVPLILERSFLKTERALIDVYEGELTLRVGKEAVTFNLDQTSRYSANYYAMSVNQIDLIDVACEEYSQEVLGFSVSGNPTPSTKPIVSNSSPTLTPFGDSDLLLEETDAFLAIDDEPISPEINDRYYDSKGDILLLEEFLNDDLSSPPLPPQEPKVVEPTTEKSSIDEPPVVELKDLPPHLEYAFLKGDDKLPVITAKDLKDKAKTALIKVLKSHK
nr:hypothetical protein [Tanacetum cinerariifolium]